MAKKKLFKNLRVGTPGNKQEIITCESEDLYKKQPHKKTLKAVGKKAMEFETPDAFVVSTVWWGQARHEDGPSLLRCHLQQ